MAVLWTFHAPSLCRHVRRELLRNAWRYFTPIIPTTACQQRNYIEPYSRYMVNDGEPELEEQAFAGFFPWIDDPEDDRNRARFGVPRAWVLSPRLVETFLRTFGQGRTD